MNDVLRKAVEQLLLEGHVILQIMQGDSIIWFAVYTWQPGYFNTAESVDFNTVEGIDITEFLSKNAAMWHNRSEFVAHFNQYIDERPLVRCEFTKTSTWYKWQTPVTEKRVQR